VTATQRRQLTSPHRTVGGRPRLDSLTGLRFVAALMVFGNHVADYSIPDARGFAADVFEVGRVGVSFFFILSGFVLTWASADAVGRPTYLWRRVARIHPSHLVTWLPGIVVFGTGGALLGPLLSLPLLQAWHPSGPVHFGGNPVSWSLSCEVFFYATFPFLVGPLASLSHRWRLGVLGLLVAAAALAPFAASAVAPDHVAYWAVYVFPPTRLLEFVAGVLLALLLIDGRLPNVSLSAAGAALAGSYLLATQLPLIHRPVSVTFVPFALLIVAAAQRDLARRPTVAARPAMVRLGEWSYAFYLVHLFALHALDQVVGLTDRSPLAMVALAALALLLAQTLAAALHLAVERPAERWLRRRGPQPGGRGATIPTLPAP
jgi:peptidoglycan/LPS O-acetylase OafA/YrhL